MTREGVILVVNCGSSSTKLGAFDLAVQTRLWSESLDLQGEREEQEVGLNLLLDRVRASTSAPVVAVGHRIVHGGLEFQTPRLITPEVEAKLAALVSLAPLHMPGNLTGVALARQAWPEVPQIACFDTAFHRTLPPMATLVAAPRAWIDRGVRRYGFHGLSFEFVANALKDAGVDLARERIVVAHLGAGASMCALRGGKSVETTMGFSTLSGLPMSTRCGDIDPDAVLHMLIEGASSPEEVRRVLYEESGLAALSGRSGDMRDLLASRVANPRAREAVDYFCYQSRRHIGSLAAVLGGLDRLVFTGGIGAKAASIRAWICDGLEFLGVALNETRNLENASIVSAVSSAVVVQALETDEECAIAGHVRELLISGSA